MYKLFIRPILFALSQNDAEKAHELTVRMIEAIQASPALLRMIEDIYAEKNPKPVTVAGVKFRNRVGLAAGLDKQAQLLPYMQAIGFGFVEIGSVLPGRQAGNPRPRLFRHPEQHSLSNCMGFNSEGARSVVNHLRQFKSQIKIPIGGSLGKHKNTSEENTPAEFITVMEWLYPYVEFYVVNVSSPNTPGLRDLQKQDHLRVVVRPVVERARRLRPKPKPVLLKLAPDLSEDELAAALDVAEAEGLSGFVLGNTTMKPPPGFDMTRLEKVAGGFSGPYTFPHTLARVKFARERTALPIVACGGIWSSDNANEVLDAGADLVEILTALIYEGPGLVQKMVSGI